MNVEEVRRKKVKLQKKENKSIKPKNFSPTHILTSSYYLHIMAGNNKSCT